MKGTQIDLDHNKEGRNSVTETVFWFPILWTSFSSNVKTVHLVDEIWK